MQYNINITGMHCTGCQNLIKIFLEDEFENVSVDLENNNAEFVSDDSKEDVENILEKIFKDDSLKQYSYNNLIQDL